MIDYVPFLIKDLIEGLNTVYLHQPFYFICFSAQKLIQMLILKAQAMAT